MSVLRRGKRRTYLRADARRAQILDVAKGVFARRGYRVANVADICSAARIGRGTLYQYFDNKQAVLLALMEDLCARVRAVIENRPRVAELARPLNPDPEAIRGFCEHRLRELLDAVFVDEETLRLMLRDARGLDVAVDDVIAMVDQIVFDALLGDLNAAQKAGFLRPGDTRLMARFILGGIEKMCLIALREDERVDLGAIVHAAVDLELFGLLSKEVSS
jgi:AcrR family transcriptional regulator